MRMHQHKRGIALVRQSLYTAREGVWFRNSTFIVCLHTHKCVRDYMWCKSKLGCEIILLILATLPYSWQVNNPPPQGWLEPLMEDFETFSLRPAKLPPPPENKSWSGLSTLSSRSPSTKMTHVEELVCGD